MRGDIVDRADAAERLVGYDDKPEHERSVVNRVINIVVCAPIIGRNLDPIRAVDASLHVIDGNDAFIAYQRAHKTQDTSAIRAADLEMHELLAQAEVLCMMYPMVATAAAQAPNLRWLHHTQAGVSNLWAADVWKRPEIIITSGRGHVRPTAIAEYCIAAALSFSRGLHDGYLDKREGRLDVSHYAPQRVAGATMGVIGLGGIGKEVARLSKALGMRVVATRRSVAAVEHDTDGADLLLPAAELSQLAAESDFIAVCTALTHETQAFLDSDFFSATTRRPLIVNISRGEVIDEDALLAALEQEQLRGAVLDVYAGELDARPPRRELLLQDNILLTPHISGMGLRDDPAFMALFCENLRRYANDEPLLNLVDRDRGY